MQSQKRSKRLYLQVVSCSRLSNIVTRYAIFRFLREGLLMAVLVVLLVAWAVFRGVGVLGISAFASWQGSAVYALAVMLVMTASAHFTGMRHDLERMVPKVFPRPMWIIYTTGVLELMGAAGLLLPRVREAAGICLIALLLAMFPANVKAAQEGLLLRGKRATGLWLRLPMQAFFIVLIWWASVGRI
jgi:uncharacterized membrane protein